MNFELISKEKVLEIAKAFLGSCNWVLEMDEEFISIPRDVNLVVATRSYIEEDIKGYTWGNHFQAKVLLEPQENGVNKYGTLALYISLNGVLISEDRGWYI